MAENREQLTGALGKVLPPDRILTDEPMRLHCSFRTGGPADYYLCVRTLRELKKVLQILREAEEPFFVLGRGTNLLPADEGYRGAIVTMTSAGVRPATDAAAEEETDAAAQHPEEDLDVVEVHACTMTAGAGASLSRVAAKARDYGLGGMEFAAGIPGSVGGGLVMNAGAYGGEMKQIVAQAQLLMPDGTVRTFGNAAGPSGPGEGPDMEFGYRTSILKRNGAIALKTTLVLERRNPEEIAARMRELAEKRRQKQPLDYPSAGSTFKRPEGMYAGKLIMESGLSGYTVGGACVSEKHSGFVINRGDATSADIRAVIAHVQETVYKNTGVHLEREVIYL